MHCKSTLLSWQSVPAHAEQQLQRLPLPPTLYSSQPAAHKNQWAESPAHSTQVHVQCTLSIADELKEKKLGSPKKDDLSTKDTTFIMCKTSKERTGGIF